MDESGADGFRAPDQPFYCHGALWIDDVTSAQVLSGARHAREELRLPNLHVSKRSLDDKIRICRAAVDWLNDKTWGLLEYSIEKDFFPVVLYTDILF